MNNVMLIGRLVKDPVIKYSSGQTQTAVGTFTLAVDEGYGENKKTNFIRCVTFGKTAENCEKFIHKGSQVAVNGRIQTGSYKDKDDKMVYTTDVIAAVVEFLGGKNNQTESSNAPDEDIPEGFEQMTTDDIPF